MATNTTVTVKGKKIASPLPANAGSVVAKTVSFDVPAGTSTNGYYTGDTLFLKNIIPKNTEIIGFWWKASVSQGATLTLAPRIYDAGNTSNTAFVTATNLTATTMTKPTLVTTNVLATAESDIAILLAGTTVGTTAATISMTFLLVSVDAADTEYSTFTI